MYFTGKNIRLRALEPEDLDWLFALENDESLWHVSQTHQPFSKYILSEYIKNAKQTLFEALQMRWVIQEKKPVGLIDLYDFDPFHKRAGVGVIMVTDFQDKGFATEALQLLISYSFDYIKLHQLYAQITATNVKSLRLFQKLGFEITGTKKDWNQIKNTYYDEHFLQLISNKINSL